LQTHKSRSKPTYLTVQSTQKKRYVLDKKNNKGNNGTLLRLCLDSILRNKERAPFHADGYFENIGYTIPSLIRFSGYADGITINSEIIGQEKQRLSKLTVKPSC
jgi:hypothetical protein